MLDFPKITEVNRKMPKEAFYRNMTLKSEIKDSFISDIKRIIILNKLSSVKMNIRKGNEVSEILVLQIELKSENLNYKILEAIAKQNAHKILFVLKYENLAQIVVFYNKLYHTEWTSPKSINLEIKGLDFDNVWYNFIAQIADVKLLEIETLDDNLNRQETINKLNREIERLEKKARAEKQPKKKFALVQDIKELKRQLEGLK